VKRSTLLLLLALVLSGGVFGAWYAKLGPFAQRPAAAAQNAPMSPGARPAPVVETAQVQIEAVSDEVEALGTLLANESVAIAPEIAGRLTSLGFREGDRVSKGQTLVELDTGILQQELKQAEVDLGLAKDVFQRANSLAERGSGTRVSLEQAEAQRAAAEVRVALAQERLQKATIQAPINGIVGLRAVSAGSYLTPGQTVVTLTDIDPIKVDFRVPELLLQSVKVGQKIRVTVDAIQGRTFDGEVYAIDPVVDVNGRAIRLRALIPNADLALRPGLFARVAIVTKTRDEALIVPESAVIPDGNAKAVYVVDDGKVKLTRVTLGKRLPGRVEVTEGLKAGHRIVTAGQIRLRDGAPVELARPQAQAKIGVTQ
jgi:membrane fusion protein (multidrug efflux system)